MREQGGGSIVNVGSVDSLIAMNGFPAYCASKWGLMYGPWMAQLVEFIDETQAYVGNRAIPGEAPLERIADAVRFFASDASAHCTGFDLPIDGGAHAGNFLPGFNTL